MRLLKKLEIDELQYGRKKRRRQFKQNLNTSLAQIYKHKIFVYRQYYKISSPRIFMNFSREDIEDIIIQKLSSLDNEESKSKTEDLRFPLIYDAFNSKFGKNLEEKR